MNIPQFSTLLFLSLPLSAQIVYQGSDGPGKGKHLVFLASDHEYRAEQTCPALARILAKRFGFKCSVLFGVDKEGVIVPGASNIKGMETLKDADGLIIFTRFLNLPDEQMEHLVGYLDRGGPLVGFRTSSHAFKIPKTSKYARFSFRWKGEDFKGGFGQKYLGNTWEGHYGENHVQGTRIQIIPEKKEHIILTGVQDHAFCFAGGYNAVLRPGMQPITMTQPLQGMDPNSKPDPKKEPVISTWTYSYKGNNGKDHRVFHSTQGASEDLLDTNYRRMVLNGILWSVGAESAIKADSDISFVGPYSPTKFKMNGGVKNQKPADLSGFESRIGAEK